MGRHVCYLDDDEKYKKFKTLYEDWTIAAIMKSLIITKEMYHEFFTKAIEEDRVEAVKPIRFKIHAKEPFSENEWDYGTTNIWPKQMKTTVKVPEPSELTVAIKTYKLQLKK